MQWQLGCRRFSIKAQFLEILEIERVGKHLVVEAAET
jgi:hypothetical protein